MAEEAGVVAAEVGGARVADAEGGAGGGFGAGGQELTARSNRRRFWYWSRVWEVSARKLAKNAERLMPQRAARSSTIRASARRACRCAAARRIAAWGPAQPRRVRRWPRVTLIELGADATTFFDERSAPITTYVGARATLAAMAEPATSGDPRATAAAILAVVDAAAPPRRLVLGATALPMIRAAYARRLATWAGWEEVSIAAQGPAAR